ncbi:AzlD domain-containing protein [Desulfoluna spongiiphila]|uniref:Branched-chain amino acid transport protein n=1 Tax=Desulfoluna spongiiphila TaxID=419481 RepID=A0A1G5FW35_9BACT|nr:AzlD domain-containing protein [Desulfoluna spongiiphila]SCY43429.1 Branched-chain amino acid transport protein [Desulfoluna spongiiphila]VVS91363.1 branched-chain amino acid transport azld [Desulfoluna spongiiphila]
METSNFVLLVLGMGLVSFIPRWVPLFFLSKRQLPSLLIEWLELIPVAILSALLVPALVTTGTPRVFNPVSIEMMVAVPTFIFAWYTKSLGGTLVVGMLLYWGAGLVL